MTLIVWQRETLLEKSNHKTYIHSIWRVFYFFPENDNLSRRKLTAWQALFVGGHLFCERATIKFLVGSTVQLSKKVILFFYYLNFSKLKNSFGFVFVIKSLIFIFIHCAPKKNMRLKLFFVLKGQLFSEQKFNPFFIPTFLLLMPISCWI